MTHPLKDHFNPRTHEECDLLTVNSLSTGCYFNPRTHEECDVIVCPYSNITIAISIHALTKSATKPSLSMLSPCLFQSTHSRRVRRDRLSLFQYHDSHFNPRTHEECDQAFTCLCCRPVNFNPRTHEECDVGLLDRDGITYVFQSTHSRGVRLDCLGGTVWPMYFNPRTHEECDTDNIHLLGDTIPISIHALTKSATLSYALAATR